MVDVTPTQEPAVNPVVNQPTIVATLNSIQDSLISIKNILQGQIQNTLVRQKKITSSRNKEDREKRQGQSKKQNLNKKTFGLRDAKELLPKVGILDFIRNFIFYTGFGFIVTRLIEHTPAILGVIKNIGPVVNNLGFIVGELFNALATSIEIAYSKFDQIRSLAKKIGGEDFAKGFDDLSSKINQFLNIFGIVAMVSVASLMEFNKIRRIRAAKEAAKVAKEAKTAATAGRGALGLGEQTAKQGISQASKKGIGNVLKLGKIGKVVPFIGTFITLAIRMTTEDEPPAKSAVAAIGSGIGQVIGSVALGAIAAALGLGVGSWVTGPIGLAVGNIVGSMAGEFLGAALYDALVGMMKPNKGENKIEPKAKGGPVGRTLKKEPKRPQRIQTKQSVPGKDIGGIKAIEQVFPNPKEEERKKNALKLLVKNANAFNKRKGDTIAQLMKFGADMQHGQKPEKATISAISNNLGIMVQNIVQEKAAKNMRSILGQVFAAADGGYIPATRTLEIEGDIAKEFKKTFEIMITQSIASIGGDIFRNLRREMGIPEPTEPSGGPGGVPSAIELGSFSDDDIDLLGKMIHAEAGNQPDEGKAAVMTVILNRYRLIKAGKSPGTFSIRQGVNKNNVTLRDILSAPSQFSPWSDIANNKVASDQGKIALDKAINAGGRQPNKLKQVLMSRGFSESDANFIVGSTYFSTNGQAMPGGPEIRLHGHVFEKAGVEVPTSLLTEIPARITRLDMSPIGEGSAHTYGVFVEGWKGNIATSYDTLDPHHHYSTGYYGVVADFTLVTQQGQKYWYLPVPSPVTGKVIFAGDAEDGFGNKVIIQSAEGTVLMGHFSEIKVRKNQSVVAFKTIVGLQGSTGRSRGPHVHMDANQQIIDRYIRTLSSRRYLAPPSTAQRPDNRRASISTPSAQIASMVIPVGGTPRNAATFEATPSQTQIAAKQIYVKGDEFSTDTPSTTSILPILIPA